MLALRFTPLLFLPPRIPQKKRAGPRPVAAPAPPEGTAHPQRSPVQTSDPGPPRLIGQGGLTQGGGAVERGGAAIDPWPQQDSLTFMSLYVGIVVIAMVIL